MGCFMMIEKYKKSILMYYIIYIYYIIEKKYERDS